MQREGELQKHAIQSGYPNPHAVADALLQDGLKVLGSLVIQQVNSGLQDQICR